MIQIRSDLLPDDLGTRAMSTASLDRCVVARCTSHEEVGRAVALLLAGGAERGHVHLVDLDGPRVEPAFDGDLSSPVRERRASVAAPVFVVALVAGGMAVERLRERVAVLRDAGIAAGAVVCRPPSSTSSRRA